jgi:hypothetical protein
LNVNKQLEFQHKLPEDPFRARADEDSIRGIRREAGHQPGEGQGGDREIQPETDVRAWYESFYIIT